MEKERYTISSPATHSRSGRHRSLRSAPSPINIVRKYAVSPVKTMHTVREPKSGTKKVFREDRPELFTKVESSEVQKNDHKNDEDSELLLGFKMNKRRESQRLMQQKEKRKMIRSKPKERHSDNEEASERERKYKRPGETTEKHKEAKKSSSKKRKAVEVSNTPVKRQRRVTHRTPTKAETSELHKSRETIVIDDSPTSSKKKSGKHRMAEEEKKDEDYELAKRLQQEEDRKLVLPYFIPARQQDRAYFSDSDYSDSELPFPEVHRNRRRVLTPLHVEEDSEEYSSEDYRYRYDSRDEDEYDDYVMFPDTESEDVEDGWHPPERWDGGRVRDNEVEEKGEPKQRIVVNLDDEDSSVEEKVRKVDKRVDTRASRNKRGTREEKKEAPKVETRSTRRVQGEDRRSQERERHRGPTRALHLPPQPAPRARWGGPPPSMMVDEYGRAMPMPAYPYGGGGRNGVHLFNMLTAVGYRAAPAPPRNADPLYALQFQDRDFTADDYDMLLQLDKNNVKKNTGEQAIKRIRAKKLRNKSELQKGKGGGGKKEDKDDEKCTICLEEFEVGCMYKTLPCTHVYHSECIDTWLKESKQCPICKKDITLK